MPAIVSPGLGLFFTLPSIALPPGSLKAGRNFRVDDGTLNNLNIGWEKLSTNWQLNGPVTVITNFFPRGGGEHLLFATTSDIYRYVSSSDTVVFLTPRYETGTAAASGTAVTGTGTAWSSNAKAGDEISFGVSGETDPTATWFVIDSVDSDLGITLTASAGTIGDGPYTIRKVFTGSLHNVWSYDVFVNDSVSGDDLWIATNGLEDVISWNGTDTQVTLHPELGFTCKAVKTYKNMMIYSNLTYSGVFATSIINSDVGSPLLAGDVGVGLSEQFVVHDGSDELLAMAELGDYLVIYSERHVVPILFVGDPLIFQFRTAITGTGLIAPRAVADFGDYHEFLGADAQYTFDGVGQTRTNNHVWKVVLRERDPIRSRLAFGHFDEERGDLIWSIPRTTDVDAGDQDGQSENAYGEHYLAIAAKNIGHPYSHRDFPFTAAGNYERAEGLTWANATGTWADYNYAWSDQFFALGFPQNLVGDKDGYIYILNEAQDGDGTALPSYVRFGRMATGDGRRRNLLRRIYPFTRSFSNTMTITVWLGDFASKVMTASEVASFDQTMPEGGHFVSIFRAARYIEVQFGTSGDPWLIEGFDTDVSEGGMR